MFQSLSILFLKIVREFSISTKWGNCWKEIYLLLTQLGRSQLGVKINPTLADPLPMLTAS